MFLREKSKESRRNWKKDQNAEIIWKKFEIFGNVSNGVERDRICDKMVELPNW